MEKSPEKLKTPESLAIACLHVYRFVATPLKLSFGLQGCCRHRPTCSHYMQEAIAVHGLGKGLGLGTRRVLRCHPWGTSGDDPVPPGNKPATPASSALHSSLTVHSS